MFASRPVGLHNRMMKNILLTVALLVSGLANAAEIPFSAALENRLLHVGNRKTIRVVYAPASNGGASTVYNLGAALPPNAIVDRVFYHIAQPFSMYGSGGTVAIDCGNVTLVPATNLTAYASGQLVDGTQTGASSLMTKFTGTSACQVKATVATRQYYAGKIVVWANYVISE